MASSMPTALWRRKRQSNGEVPACAGAKRLLRSRKAIVIVFVIPGYAAPSRLRSSLFAPASAGSLLPLRQPFPYCFPIPPPDFLPRVQKDPHLPRAGYQPGDGVA